MSNLMNDDVSFINGLLDDFEVSVFLTDTSTPHQLLTKAKSFAPSGRKSNLRDWLEPTANLSHATSAASGPEDVSREIIHIREESDDDDVVLANIPSASPSANGAADDADQADQAHQRRQRDDRKLVPRTTYSGFSIHRKVLCLVVKRRISAAPASKHRSSQQMMENWVLTQAAHGTLDEVPESG
jgi:hypothetical protein